MMKEEPIGNHEKFADADSAITGMSFWIYCKISIKKMAVKNHSGDPLEQDALITAQHEDYHEMDRRLHQVQDKLQWLLLRQQQWTPENRPFRRYLCKQLAIGGVLSGIALAGSLVLAKGLHDSNSSWSITGGLIGGSALMALVAFFCKLCGENEPRIVPVSETNILLALPPGHKEILTESGVIASTVNEITPEQLSNQINQRRRQFMLFATLDAQKLSSDISLIVAQYDEEVAGSCLPEAGDYALGKCIVSGRNFC